MQITSIRPYVPLKNVRLNKQEHAQNISLESSCDTLSFKGGKTNGLVRAAAGLLAAIGIFAAGATTASAAQAPQSKRAANPRYSYSSVSSGPIYVAPPKMPTGGWIDTEGYSPSIHPSKVDYYRSLYERNIGTDKEDYYRDLYEQVKKAEEASSTEK